MAQNKSLLDRILDVSAISAGAYHGFCDARQMPFSREYAEMALNFGPATINAGCSLLRGMLIGLTQSKKRFFGCDLRSRGEIAEDVFTTGIGHAVAGFALTGLKTLVGYGLGYATGYSAQ